MAQGGRRPATALQLELGGSTVRDPGRRSSPTARRSKSYAGKDVVVGVRSEDMEDAVARRRAPAERRIKGKVTLTEALGSQIIVHFTFPGRPVVTEDTKLLAKETGGASCTSSTDDRASSGWPRSRRAPGCRMGDEIEIAVDIERAHFFDPETSQAIRT